MASPTPLRRQPVQQRSARRVEKMLQACASLIDDLGYDGVTTTLIAEKAGVAVGSLYQFFPDKRAVVQALTQRNLDHYIRTTSERLDTIELEHWWDAVDVCLDAYVELHRTVPAFARIRFGDVVDLRLIDEERENNTVVADRLIELLATRFNVPREEVATQMAVAVAVADGVLNLAFRDHVLPEDTVVNETRKIIRAYLSGQL
ncbi:TetR family transcriptional regulator [Herbihabitans rhizosphaerae]|uniref:TetR family transcriptional regulator n=1 Tax=Herbihabitans rhizosphaerae TaxID=1872711 RepID=A0A4Q7KMI6_9PSEU|nr:TetR/AcrR family transcriptional regulator [Herbihabitans rhizosphaerae]RZS37524.1 TetR family transcriptional regulator [Herbihabitans rhizosphaerae]